METEQMAEVYGAPGTRPSDRDSKAARKQAKADAKRAAHAESQRGAVFTPAQRIMRREMADMPKLGQVIDATVGNTVNAPGQMVSESIALEIIAEHGQGIRTGLGEWAIIQDLIQRGVKRGIQIGRYDGDLPG